MTESISQVLVGDHRIGIIGLKEAFEDVALHHGDATDETVSVELYRRLSVRNYIPSSVRARYEAAFLREYRKYLGLPVTEESAAQDDNHIRILGEGCASCHRMKEDLIAVLSELNLPAAFDHVTDPMEIAAWGPVNRPALAVGRRILSSGRILNREQLKSLILQVFPT
jgi:hypothetical protein